MRIYHLIVRDIGYLLCEGKGLGLFLLGLPPYSEIGLLPAALEEFQTADKQVLVLSREGQSGPNMLSRAASSLSRPPSRGLQSLLASEDTGQTLPIRFKNRTVG